MTEENRYYIGLDVGTSGCKAAVVDIHGNIHAIARREYAFIHPQKGWVELDPDEVWNKVKETLTEIASYGYEIRKMSVSSIGESMVMVDEYDQVVRNGIVYLDDRGPETMDEVREKIDDLTMQKITGVVPHLSFSLNRILWMRKNDPLSIERTKHYFLFGDYITYKLTGSKLIDLSSASKTSMLDIDTFDWSKEIADAFDIPIEKFSKIVSTGTIAGRILPKIAEDTGLTDTLEVVVGCHDQCAAALGAGCVKKGEMFAGEGSSECLAPIIEKADITEQFLGKGLCVEPHIIPGTFLVPAGMYAHGSCIRWFVNQFYSDLKSDDGKSSFELANDICAKDAGELIFLPYLSRSNILDPENKSLGLFIGMEFETDRQKMYRAVLEGIAFESQFSLEIVKTTNVPVDEIKELVAVGGCSKSDVYMQMKADILNKKVSVLENADAGIAALVMICAVADGVYESYDEAKAVFVKIKREFFPEKDYSKKFEKYLKVREAVKQLYENI